MRYTVQWTETAEQSLADIWLRAADRNAINLASNRIDPELAVSPETKGTDFYGDRLLLVALLHVVYRVDSAQQIVAVLDLWSV